MSGKRRGGNVAATAFSDFKKPGPLSKNQRNGGIWRCGIILYIIDVDDEGLEKLIRKTVKESNDSVNNVKWVERKKHHSKLPIITSSNFVIFIQDNKSNPWSDVGCQVGVQNISLCYPYYPGIKYELQNICILHEMMHTMGFEHEHARVDREAYGVTIEDDYEDDINNVQFDDEKDPHVPMGKYDLYSVMHYGEGACGVKILDDKYKKIVANPNEIESYSDGDKASIDKMYRKEALRWVSRLYVTSIIKSGKSENKIARSYGLDSKMVKKASKADTVDDFEKILISNGITESEINKLISAAFLDILKDNHQSLPYNPYVLKN